MAFWERADIARQRLQWAHESLHLSQAGFIRLFIDLGLDQFMGETKSASTIKAYLQGNVPKGSPEVFDRLVGAAALFFGIESEVFYSGELGRDELTQRVRRGFQNRLARLHELGLENQQLKYRLADLERNLESRVPQAPILPAAPRTVPSPAPSTVGSSRFLFAAAAMLVLGLLSGAFILSSSPSRPKYPARKATEILAAALDGRDLWLNSPATPMMTAYGSRLCLTLVDAGFYVSVFVEDRDYFFNQEGRLLFRPTDIGQRCTGIWPGHPDAFHKTLYRLYIVISAEKLPISGDSDRLRVLPPGSYYGPVYLQRME